jgi:hypothetical protein
MTNASDNLGVSEGNGVVDGVHLDEGSSMEWSAASIASSYRVEMRLEELGQRWCRSCIDVLVSLRDRTK